MTTDEDAPGGGCEDPDRADCGDRSRFRARRPTVLFTPERVPIVAQLLPRYWAQFDTQTIQPNERRRLWRW